MGAVHSEVLSQNRGCHEWEAISLSEINTVKGLIKNRSKFDEMYQLKIFESKSPLVLNGTPTFHEIIECTYLDLERLIENSKLNDKQRKIIKYLMLGYTEQDIADELKTSLENICRVFDTICNKIVEQNNFEWNEWKETSGHVKIEDNVRYKKCRRCNKWLNVNEENFSPNKDAKDGFRNICKACR